MTQREGEYVQVPLSLWNAACSCFYGNGPRYSDMLAARQSPPPLPEAPPAGGENALPTGLTITGGLPRSWVPRGFAAPPAPVAKPKLPEEAKK